ncbi:hypothetical protein [Trujillonella humicola]|uniref:hypothetical protein n=1 Tax=Trujillonella humicola TaxID=3383699 RepID=UPI003905CCC5
MSRPSRRPPGRRPRSRAAAGALAGVLLVAGCGSDGGADDAASSSTEPADDHGYVAGAEELPEPQLQLAYLDEAGSVHALDLLTEEATALGEVGDVSAVATDGRFVFAASEPAGELTVVDTGTWTVDHGDHVHYYRAPRGSPARWTGTAGSGRPPRRR